MEVRYSYVAKLVEFTPPPRPQLKKRKNELENMGTLMES